MRLAFIHKAQMFKHDNYRVIIEQEIFSGSTFQDIPLVSSSDPQQIMGPTIKNRQKFTPFI